MLCYVLCMKIMVLDCGGGTIDITSHLVESSDPLQLSELAEPCGGAWGSSIVDARFKAFLQVSCRCIRCPSYLWDTTARVAKLNVSLWLAYVCY